MQHELLRSQRNELFRWVQDAGFDPNDFKWMAWEDEDDSALGPTLLYRGPERFFFRFERTSDGAYWVTYSPTAGQVVAHTIVPSDWKDQLGYVGVWLEHLKRELREPDLWRQLAESQIGPGVSADPEGGNRAFTVAEAKQITAGVEAMREYLATECPEAAEVLEPVNETLGHIAEAANRQGRIDWLNMCIGALFSTGIDRLLTPEHGTKLMELLKGSVSGIVTLLN